MKQLKTILRFEYFGCVKSKSFIAITVVICAAIGLILSIPPLLDKGESPITPPAKSGKILIVDKAGILSDVKGFKEAIPEYSFNLEKTVNLDSMKQQINDGLLRAALVIKTPLEATFFEERFLTGDLKIRLDSVLDTEYKKFKLRGFGLDETEISQVIALPEVLVEETGKSLMKTYFYTYILIMLLYITIMSYGQLVATSVAAEKSSRAMELLITSAKTNNLLFGKIIGSGLAGLTQIALILLTAFGFMKLNYAYWEDNEVIGAVFHMPANIVFYTLLFYILGYFCYAVLFGALGSLISRTEDLSIASTPIIFVVVGSFLLAFFGMNHPDSLVIRIFSFIPFFSQMVMFVRICVSSVPAVEIVISVLILIATIFGVTWISAKIYRIGTLIYGKAPSLKSIAAALKADRQSKKL